MLGERAALLHASGGDGLRDAFHVSLDPATQDEVEVLVGSVAAIESVAQTDLPPLGDVVEPEALSAGFGPTSEESAADVRATFVYEGLEFTIDAG